MIFVSQGALPVEAEKNRNICQGNCNFVPVPGNVVCKDECRKAYDEAYDNANDKYDDCKDNCEDDYNSCVNKC